jgi:hypothetical protein
MFFVPAHSLAIAQAHAAAIAHAQAVAAAQAAAQAQNSLSSVINTPIPSTVGGAVQTAAIGIALEEALRRSGILSEK